MKLRDLVPENARIDARFAALDITGIAVDSRTVAPGFVFVAVPGTGAEAAPALLTMAWSSASALAIAPLQDVLNLGKEARMNQPGSARGNWRWRVTDAQLSESALASLRDLTRATARTEPAMAAAS